jgi:hypothetical protein
MDSAVAYYSLLSPIVALGANVITQVLIVRLRRGRQFFRAIIEGFALGLPVLIAIEFLISRSANNPGLVVALFVNAPTYAALSFCYYAVASLGHASIRMRLYSEIAAAKDGKSVAEVEGIYPEETLIQLRLQRLTRSGDLIQEAERYFVGRERLLFVANMFFTAKQILLGKKSEFD